MPIKDIKKGQRLSSREMRQLARKADDARRVLVSGGMNSTGTNAPGGSAFAPTGGEDIWIKNECGFDLPAYRVVFLREDEDDAEAEKEGVLKNPSYYTDRKVVTAIDRSAETDVDYLQPKFAITQEVIPEGQTGRGRIRGFAYCRRYPVLRSPEYSRGRAGTPCYIEDSFNTPESRTFTHGETGKQIIEFIREVYLPDNVNGTDLVYIHQPNFQVQTWNENPVGFPDAEYTIPYQAVRAPEYLNNLSGFRYSITIDASASPWEFTTEDNLDPAGAPQEFVIPNSIVRLPRLAATYDIDWRISARMTLPTPADVSLTIGSGGDNLTVSTKTYGVTVLLVAIEDDGTVSPLYAPTTSVVGGAYLINSWVQLMLTSSEPGGAFTYPNIAEGSVAHHHRLGLVGEDYGRRQVGLMLRLINTGGTSFNPGEIAMQVAGHITVRDALPDLWLQPIFTAGGYGMTADTGGETEFETIVQDPGEFNFENEQL